MAGFHGNLQKIRLSEIKIILAISLLPCSIERHIMRYEITALPEFYNVEFQNQLSKIIQCLKFASLSVIMATTFVSITLHLV